MEKMTKVRKTPVITLSMVEFRGTKLELCEVPGAFFVVAVVLLGGEDGEGTWPGNRETYLFFDRRTRTMGVARAGLVPIEMQQWMFVVEVLVVQCCLARRVSELSTTLRDDAVAARVPKMSATIFIMSEQWNRGKLKRMVSEQDGDDETGI